MAGSNITCRLFAAFERFKNPNLIRLAKYLPAYKGKIGLAVCCMLTAGLSSSLIATLLGRLTDAGFYQQQAWVVLAAPIGLILISLLHGGSMFGSNYLLGQVSQSILLELRRQYSTACCIGPQKPISRIQPVWWLPNSSLKRTLRLAMQPSLRSLWCGTAFRSLRSQLFFSGTTGSLP